MHGEIDGCVIPCSFGCLCWCNKWVWHTLGCYLLNTHPMYHCRGLYKYAIILWISPIHGHRHQSSKSSNSEWQLISKETTNNLYFRLRQSCMVNISALYSVYGLNSWPRGWRSQVFWGFHRSFHTNDGSVCKTDHFFPHNS